MSLRDSTGGPPAGAASSRWRWTVAQIGHREEYAAARAFAADGRLDRLYTDMWCRHGAPALRRGPAPLRRLALRYHPALRDARVVAWTPSMLARTLTHAVGRRGRRDIDYDDYVRIGDWFDRRVAQHLGCVPEVGTHSFFGYNTGCLETLRQLRERGVPAVVDAIHPGRTEYALVRGEAERWPGWEPAPSVVPEAYFERLAAEWDAATGVVVNSQWSADALVQQGVARERIVVVPLAYVPQAVPVGSDGPRPPVPQAGRRSPLTVLWLGSVNLRKGIPYLVEAARLLADRSLRFVVVGPLEISDRAVASAPPSVELRGPLTHDRIHDAYAAAHVFVLPTISDGFAITQLEALAHGLPVVTTPNCGQVVDHGQDGMIVPAADATALAAALAALDDDRDLLGAMSERAPLKARQFSLDRYRTGLDDAVTRLAGAAIG
ncbi:MAG: glycosyltransferase family 4 protein [Acidimicrobiales bacterium]